MLKGIRIENPILHIVISFRSLITSLVPGLLNLADEVVFVLFGPFLDVFAFATEVGLQSIDIPTLVRSGDVGVPILLHKVFKILAICRLGIGNVMVGEPLLELSLMPFVVC